LGECISVFPQNWLRPVWQRLCVAGISADLVERNQWLTSQQLLDAVAIGQLTPGPVFTTATLWLFACRKCRAIAGTIGIFLPAFLLVWFVNPLVPKLRQSSWASGFLDGVNAASLGLRGHLYFRADCSSRLVDSRSGNFERDRGFRFRLTLPG